MIKKILFFFLLITSSISFSQNQLLSENATVSVFTCGKGAELYSTFGHTAIRITDATNNLDVVYNYGAFDFRTENFYLKFVKGDLQYFMIATSFNDFIYEYQMDNREVIEQTLNVPLAKKQQLFERLNASLFSEERSYTYKFIDKNCTTMVLNKINETIGGNPLLKKVDDTSISYRALLYPFFEDHFWYKLGINIIFGAPTDKKATQLFLPVELLNSLDKAKIDRKPLVIEKTTIVKAGNYKTSFSFFNSIFFVASLLLIIAIINNRKLFLSYLFVLGIFGLFLSLVGCYSYHNEISWNYNALLFNPLFLLLPFLKGKWFKNVCLLSLTLIGIYCIVMINKPHLLLMIPFIMATIYCLLRVQKTNKNLLTSVK